MRKFNRTTRAAQDKKVNQATRMRINKTINSPHSTRQVFIRKIDDKTRKHKQDNTVATHLTLRQDPTIREKTNYLDVRLLQARFCTRGKETNTKFLIK